VKCEKIKQLEIQGNLISREISTELSQTFITPLDREDIHAFNMAQEDLLNAIRAISSRIGLYRFDSPERTAVALVENIDSPCRPERIQAAASWSSCGSSGSHRRKIEFVSRLKQTRDFQTRKVTRQVSDLQGGSFDRIYLTDVRQAQAPILLTARNEILVRKRGPFCRRHAIGDHPVLSFLRLIYLRVRNLLPAIGPDWT